MFHGPTSSAIPTRTSGEVRDCVAIRWTADLIRCPTQRRFCVNAQGGRGRTSAWIVCTADARPLADYADLLAAAGLKTMAIEEHNGALIDFVNQIRTRLLVTDVIVGLNKLALPRFDIAMAKDFTRRVLEAIKAGKIGYAILTAVKGG